MADWCGQVWKRWEESNSMSGGILAAVIILILLIALAVAPGLADRVNEILSPIRDRLTAIALGFLGVIQGFWGMKGRQEHESEWATKRLNKEVERRAKKLGISDRTIADAMAMPLSTAPADIDSIAPQIGNPASQAGYPAPQAGYPASQAGNQPASANTPTVVPPAEQLGVFQRIGHFFVGTQTKNNDIQRDPYTEAQEKTDDIKRVLSIRKQVADEYGLVIAEKKKEKTDKDGKAQTSIEEVWQAKAPGNQDMVTAWSLRFVYIVLVLVCVAADYVFTSSRAPTVIGGGSFTPPPFLQGLFQYLPVITGVLFVAIAALSGMLIDEFAVSHSNYVKIWPYVANALRIIGLVLAVVMFVVDVIAVIFLVIVGFAFQESIALPFYVVLIVLVSIALVIALGVLLAFPGLWQGLAALGLLIFGGVAALLMYALALVVVVLGAIVALLAEINRLIWGQRSGKPQTKINADTRNLAIVGYGSVGSDWVVDLTKEFAALYGPHIWLLGTNETDQNHIRQRNVIRQLIRAHDISAPTSAGIVDKLTNNYSGKRKDEIKPLLWIVRDKQLGDCLDSLQALGAQVTQSKADFTNVQLVLFWILSQGATNDPAIQDLAADLQAWTERPGSILKTTVIYEIESPAKRWGDKRDPLFKRGFAALLGAGFTAPESSFATAVTEMQNSKYSFSYLAAGSMGIVPAQQNFQTGFVSGRAGEINPLNASRRMGFLAGEMLKDQTCSTIPDKAMEKPKSEDRPQPPATNDPAEMDAYNKALTAWQESQRNWLNQQANVFVNIVVPTQRKALKQEQRNRFQSIVCEWMRDDYGIYEQHVTVVPVGSDKDHGIDVKAQWEMAAGDYYFTMTALRGVSNEKTAAPAIPLNLQGGIASEDRLANLDKWYPKPKSPPAAENSATQNPSAPQNPAPGNGNSGASMPTGSAGGYPIPAYPTYPAPPPFPASREYAGSNGSGVPGGGQTGSQYPNTSAAQGGAPSAYNGVSSATPTQPGSNFSGYVGPNSLGYPNQPASGFPDPYERPWDSGQVPDQPAGPERDS
jgi:hypothetical protein